MRTVPLGWCRAAGHEDGVGPGAGFDQDLVANLLGHAEPIPVAHGQRLADPAVREDAARDFILELDHDPQDVVPTGPVEGISEPLEAGDDGVEQPGVHQGAEHVTHVRVLPRPGHGRLVADAAFLGEAVHHDGDVHGQAGACLREAGGLQDTRGADATGRQHDDVTAGREGLRPQGACNTCDVAIFDQDALDAGTRPQVRAGRDRLVHVFGRVPFGLATSKHTPGPHTPLEFRPRWTDEFELGLPIITNRAARAIRVEPGRAAPRAAARISSSSTVSETSRSMSTRYLSLTRQAGRPQPQYMLVAPPTIGGRTMFSPSSVNSRLRRSE
jgi:hypothetical protein